MTCGIYEIRNTVAQRSYVGSSRHIGRRWALHRDNWRKGINTKQLQAAWDTDGADALTLHILEEVGKDQLLAAEQRWIDDLSARYPAPLYNVRSRATRQPELGSPRLPETTRPITVRFYPKQLDRVRAYQREHELKTDGEACGR